MSEYQYYEFRAIDRPLSKEEMAELRELTTRATITPTRLQNVYHWGNFKGDPAVLMEKYFDAFFYLANWGTHEFMLRLPCRLLDLETASLYCQGESAVARGKGEHVNLEFRSEDEDGDGWMEDEACEEELADLLPLRAELASGDLRGLYLGWLLCAQNAELDDEELEPPVPAGLGNLSAALQAFAGFMRIGGDLIAVAAERSTRMDAVEPSPGELRQWVRGLAESEKNSLLLRWLEGNDPHLRTELWRRFQQERTKDYGQAAPETRRTVIDLLEAAEQHAERRRRQEREREARERERQEREAAIARARYLDSLVGREEEIWRQIETLIAAKQARPYDQAVQLLINLRDLGARGGRIEEFQSRLARLRAQHQKKIGLLQRLDRSGL